LRTSRSLTRKTSRRRNSKLSKSSISSARIHRSLPRRMKLTSTVWTSSSDVDSCDSHKQDIMTKPINFEDEIDVLFGLPLPEFTPARNALATRLKQAGRNDDATRAKTLMKPSVSAWAVNQLYWKHRDAFDRLMESGQRLRKAQAAQLAGKSADMPSATAARQ